MTVNPQIALARDFIENTATSVFLTGRAGTGKTTFLKNLRETSPKRMIVVAPTGVAAINAGGVTIHSFFQMPFGIYVPGMAHAAGEEIRRFSKVKIALIKSIDLLVIDEISMVRADLLDNIDEVLRRFRDRSKPFGGVQLLMIGDVQQLSPVTKDDEWAILKSHYRSPYFFESNALRQTAYVTIELKHIYRQTDREFIGLLARVRDNTVDRATLDALNARCRPDFDPPQSEGYITLSSHNATAKAINDRKLAALPGREYSFEASVEGEFPDYLYPCEETLRLKKDAQVMFTKNDHSPEKRYVNGTIGVVTAISADRIEVLPGGAGQAIAVEKDMWENLRYSIDPSTGQVISEMAGVFTQYPLRTAWAITIHKSQGLTFDRAVIDAADSFSHGQVYVALSRCRTLEGIVLRSPLPPQAIISDRAVGDFSHYVETNQPSEEHLDNLKQRYYYELLTELFDFRALFSHHKAVGRFLEEHLWRLYPKLAERWKESEKEFSARIMEVSLRFRLQIDRMSGPGCENDEHLRERVAKGAAYFSDQCASLVLPLLDAARVSIDNKEHKKTYGELLSRLGAALRIKLSTLNAALDRFSVTAHLEARAAAIAQGETASKPKAAKAAKEAKTEKEDPGRDILVPELFETLREWRLGEARRREVAAFVIATQKALTGIANTMPLTMQELMEIKGVGKTFAENYGQTVIKIISDYRDGKI